MANICQSCGMPLSKDPQGGGLETDGSRSATYCSLCYDNGAFLHLGFDAAEMQVHCVGQLKKQGMPSFMGWLFTRGIPKLDRWRDEASH